MCHTLKKQISLFLFNSFFLVLYPLFSLQNNLSTFKTQSQLSNQTSNDLFEILVSFSLALLPSPFSFFHHSPFAPFHTYTHRRAPFQSTTQPQSDSQLFFKTDNCCPNHRCHCTRRSNSKACTGGSIFSPPPAQQCP